VGAEVAERQEGYVFLGTGEGEALSFEIFKRDDRWCWHPRPHFSSPGDAHGPLATTEEAYQDALHSPDAKIRT